MHTDTHTNTRTVHAHSQVHKPQMQKVRASDGRINIQTIQFKNSKIVGSCRPWKRSRASRGSKI